MAIPKKNPPAASILMNSMRAMGYSFESAIADIVDNSISAGARKIQLNFPSDPANCVFTICDDGKGMSSEMLSEAMKYGSAAEGLQRHEDDLGRFGLGLKSASLSQCRKLIVASKKDGKISSYAWDLDFIEQLKDGWWMQELEEHEISALPNIEWFENNEQGTLVVWENFDILNKASGGQEFYSLLEHRERLTNYLQLIFHRFLNEEKEKKVSILIDEYELEGFDPFMEKKTHNKSTNEREVFIPIEDSNGIERLIKVKPFVLPFQKDLSDADIKRLGGIENYQMGQGFYVYRNKRLIIWGTWFRMKPRYELTKHARIRVDIPNTLDDIWCIDIKKQNAVLPSYIKNQLVTAVENVMNIALKVQKFRGRIENKDNNIEYIWQKHVLRDNKFAYKIKRDAAIFNLLDNVDEQARRKFDLILDEIEQNIDYQQIYIDMCENKIDKAEDDSRLRDIEVKARQLINIYVMAGQSKETAITNIFKSEPFCNYKDLIKKIMKGADDE